jgi:serpin B
MIQRLNVMSNRQFGVLLRYLHRVAPPEPGQEVSDSALIERFVQRREEAAFADLVRRHGPMVLAACRRVLKHEQDAEDAFQATFLVLARKASSIRRCSSVGGWLYRVARHVALDARGAAQRRETIAQRVGATETADTALDASAMEIRDVLDEELRKLPEKYCLPIVLCHLEGKTHAEAARELGWPTGTVAGRLSRARDVLRGRLARRGITLAGVAVAAVLEKDAAAAVAIALIHTTVKMGLLIETGVAAAGVPVSVATLVEGVIRTMFVSKLKFVGAVVLGLCLFSAVGGALLSGLKAEPPTASNPPVTNPRRVAEDPPKVPAKVEDPPKRPGNAEAPPPEADVKAVVNGNNAFALDLYARLRSKDGNLFFSPHSVSAAFAMVFAGADGDTEKQMAKVLHFDLGQDRLHPAFASVLKELNDPGDKRKYELSSVAGLWKTKRSTVLEEYRSLVKQHYGAEVVQEVDSFGTAAARRDINKWVEQQTHDKVKELFKPNSLSHETQRVLVNAVYFKGAWAAPFPEKKSEERPFHVAANKNVKAPFMVLELDDYGESFKEGFKYLKDETFQALELPYAGKELSMVIFLPNEVDGLPGFEKELTGNKIDQWLGKMKPEFVEVALPRFKAECEFNLLDTLKAMGMTDAFNGSKADFSRMSKDHAFIDVAVHKAVIEVNEKGAEAAAATGIGIPIGIVNVFKADHPFLYLIRDRCSGGILFLGRVADPRE